MSNGSAHIAPTTQRRSSWATRGFRNYGEDNSARDVAARYAAGLAAAERADAVGKRTRANIAETERAAMIMPRSAAECLVATLLLAVAGLPFFVLIRVPLDDYGVLPLNQRLDQFANTDDARGSNGGSAGTGRPDQFANTDDARGSNGGSADTGRPDQFANTDDARGSNGGSAGTGNKLGYELYPFLVSADDDAKLDRLPSQPLPNFPEIPRLEGCWLEYEPTELPRTEADWRPPFWMPAFPGSGAHDPSRKTSVLKEIAEGLFLGADYAAAEFTPVKNFHVAVPGKMQRCRGITETVGCTCHTPMTSTNPEPKIPGFLTGSFRPGAILAVRNPATAIPIFFAYKHVKFHGGDRQAPEEAWRKMRDEYWKAAFDNWLDILKFWRGAAAGANYHTALYLPYEDLVTTDAARGVAAVQRLAEALGDEDVDGVAFATALSPSDHECLWYGAAQREWEHQQELVGNYIPAYTRAQRDMMVRDLRTYAAEVEGTFVEGGSDAALVSLLRRYADQIEAFVRVE